MATLKEIRKKLHSVKNVQKITQAMEMVARARLKSVQTRCENARPYLKELKLILNNLLATSDDLTHPLISEREVKRVGIVVITADKGLCGAYNNNIFSETKNVLSSYDSKNVDLFLVGNKAIQHFDKKQWNIAYRLNEWADKITHATVEPLSKKLMQMFLEGAFDEVWLIYTHFNTIMTRTVMREKLLPLALPPVESEGVLTSYIFEPSEQQIFNSILPRYCSSKLQLALFESLTSELAARIMAMRGATKNAEELAYTLTLERNKLRQAGITRELLEITSGAEASKSLF
ncbi:MAG: ATP synthase F1 subunit gamma [Verrucomicrobia bacterium]|nr:ATP synthase F1 subunit gamma [Verrucomicrobiota bacterium]MBS0636107.1 ATP synthase F1 subunit gamma [Verrucomicrobiota bacterium]